MPALLISPDSCSRSGSNKIGLAVSICDPGWVAITGSLQHRQMAAALRPAATNDCQGWVLRPQLPARWDDQLLATG